VLTVSEFKLRLTVWSLIDQSVQYIPYPKHESKAIDFSPDGKLMAVALKGSEQTASNPDKFASDVIAIYQVST
jgi:glucose/arabinose dehydrogenase